MRIYELYMGLMRVRVLLALVNKFIAKKILDEKGNGSIGK